MPRPGEKHLVAEWELQGNGPEKLPSWFGKKAEHPEQCLSQQLNKVINRARIHYPP